MKSAAEQLLEMTKVTGFEAGKFTIAQPNGTSVSAPLEFWVAALVMTLTGAQREALLAHLDNIMKKNLIVRSTDDLPYHISTLG